MMFLFQIEVQAKVSGKDFIHLKIAYTILKILKFVRKMVRKIIASYEFKLLFYNDISVQF
jgi:hypothetical protein